MGQSIGHNRLKSFVERIERLKDEQDALGKDIREVYAEAKNDGFDKTALGQVVSIRRKKAKDSAAFEELSAIVQLYLDTLDNERELEHARAHAHEAPHTDVAQPAEQAAHNGEVAGSSPAVSTNSNRAPDPLSSGSATGGTADFSPAVPPTHSNLPASYEVGHFPQTNGGDDETNGGDDESAHLNQPEYVNPIGRQSQNDVTPAPSGGPNTGRPVQLGPTGFGGSPHREDVQFSRAAPHSNPVTAAAREASATGQGGAEVSVTAPPEPDIPTFLDRRNRP